MATRTQVQMEALTGCIHEQIYQAAYEQQWRRIGGLCQWMAPDARQAERLTLRVFVEAWSGPAGAAWSGCAPEGSAAWDEDRLAETFTRQFHDLFHGECPNPARGTALAAPVGLRAAVSALSPPQRLLYLLHELEGYSPATLGHWLDLEPDYCARMVHQARLQLFRAAIAD